MSRNDSARIYTAIVLVCHLLRIRTERDLRDSPFAGAVFEGFIATEIVKSQINRGLSPELYYFRDEHGTEVDFVVPGVGGSRSLYEPNRSSWRGMGRANCCD